VTCDSTALAMQLTTYKNNKDDPMVSDRSGHPFHSSAKGAASHSADIVETIFDPKTVPFGRTKSGLSILFQMQEQELFAAV
jgi:hypothetical protein